MDPSTPRVPLTEAEFARLRELIRQHSGLHFPSSKQYLLESRLQERLMARRVSSFSGYIDFLETPAGKQEEMTFLFNQVTTNETSFFRNAPQVSALQYRVLPELMEHRRGSLPRIKMWSAGCSSGEEAYTMVIAACEAVGEELDRWRLEILANDISEEMLAQARLGEYDDHTMRATPLDIRERYFAKTASGGWKVLEPAKSLVRFRSMNLTDSAAMKSMRGFDVIFCRNVLIYLDDSSRNQILQHLYDALAPGGWLFLGHSESAQSSGLELELVRLRGAVAYRKEAN